MRHKYKNSVNDMLDLKEKGYSQSQIAAELGVSLGVVAGCLARRRKAVAHKEDAELRALEMIREPWTPTWPKDNKVEEVIAR